MNKIDQLYNFYCVTKYTLRSENIIVIHKEKNNYNYCVFACFRNGIELKNLRTSGKREKETANEEENMNHKNIYPFFF